MSNLQAIENRARQSPFMHLFLHECQIVGYSMVITVITGAYLYLIAMAPINEAPPGSPPKVNSVNLIVFYLLPLLFWMALFLSLIQVQYFVTATNITIPNLKFHITRKVIQGTLVGMLSGGIVYAVITSLGYDLFFYPYNEVVMRVFAFMALTVSDADARRTLINKINRLYLPSPQDKIEDLKEALNKLEDRPDSEIIDQAKNSKNDNPHGSTITFNATWKRSLWHAFSLTGFHIIALILYIDIFVLLYRLNATAYRAVFILFIHPLITEIYKVIMKVDFGSGKKVHPFYDHTTSFCVENTLILFRRLLFINSGTEEVIYLLVVFSGIEDIFLRLNGELFDSLYRRVLCMPPHTEQEILERKKFYSAVICSQAIMETSSIVTSAIMLFIFSGVQRYFFNFGYVSSTTDLGSINVTVIMHIVVMQLVVEGLIDIGVGILEEARGIPISDFFFHLRTPDVFFSHVVGLIISVSWMFEAFMTVPSNTFCPNQNPCSCWSHFDQYASICSSSNSYNGTNSSSIAASSFDLSSLLTTNTAVIFVICLGVLFMLILVFVWAWKRKNSAKVLAYSATIEEERKKLDVMKNVASNGLMQSSSLQQAIVAIETLSRGAAPGQQKILNEVLYILKTPNKVRQVDIDGMLDQSGSDENVKEWLRAQLEAHDVTLYKETLMTRSSITNTLLTEDTIKDMRISRRQTMDNPVKIKAARRASLQMSGFSEMEAEEILEEIEESASAGTDSDLSRVRGMSSDDGIQTSSQKFKTKIQRAGVLKDTATSAKIDANVILLMPVEANPDVKKSAWFVDLLNWDFNVFDIGGPLPLASLGWESFSFIGCLDRIKVSTKELQNLMIFIDRNYSLPTYGDEGGESYGLIMSEHRDLNGEPKAPPNVAKTQTKAVKINQYHNNFHAADVFQAVISISLTNPEVGSDFTSLDLFSVLFAAYIHDFAHPGVNSGYINSTWPTSSISTTFGIESPLERHHLASTFNVLRQQEYNFLQTMPLADITHFRNIVIECVLVTDLAKNMQWMSTATAVFVDNEGNGDRDRQYSLFGKSNQNFASSNDVNRKSLNSRMQMLDSSKIIKRQESKLLRMQLAVKCADISHPARTLEVHLDWSQRINEEFYAQGDLEKSQHMKISPLCDRDVASHLIPQGQIGFINFVTRPAFNLLASVCNDGMKKPWLENLDSNVRYWELEKKRYAANDTPSERSRTDSGSVTPSGKLTPSSKIPGKHSPEGGSPPLKKRTVSSDKSSLGKQVVIKRSIEKQIMVENLNSLTSSEGKASSPKAIMNPSPLSNKRSQSQQIAVKPNKEVE